MEFCRPPLPEQSPGDKASLLKAFKIPSVVTEEMLDAIQDSVKEHCEPPIWYVLLQIITNRMISDPEIIPSAAEVGMRDQP